MSMVSVIDFGSPGTRGNFLSPPRPRCVLSRPVWPRIRALNAHR